MTARFCSRCGAPLDRPPPTRCGACGYELYVNARPTASLIVLDGQRFLALKRAIEPGAGRWELPGGFCDGWEHPADAAVREAREELGVRVELGKLVGMYLGTYEFQGEAFPVLDCFYLAAVAPGEVLRINPTESTDHTWFAVDDPPPLAFETMDLALRDAGRRLVR